MSETLQATDVEASSSDEAEPQSQSKTEDLLVQEGDVDALRLPRRGPDHDAPLSRNRSSTGDLP